MYDKYAKSRYEVCAKIIRVCIENFLINGIFCNKVEENRCLENRFDDQ